MVQGIKTAGKSRTKFIWVLVAGKSGAEHLNSRKICDKVLLALGSRKIWCKASKTQENV